MIPGTRFLEVKDLVDIVIAEIKVNADRHSRRAFEEQDKQLCLELAGGQEHER